MKDIAKSLFYISLTSYGFFLALEYLRPGFVSHTFSVHLFLLVVIVSGVWWLSFDEEEAEHSIITRGALFLCRIVTSVVLFVVLYEEGVVFGDLRVFLALVAAFLPWMVGSRRERE